MNRTLRLRIIAHDNLQPFLDLLLQARYTTELHQNIRLCANDQYAYWNSLNNGNQISLSICKYTKFGPFSPNNYRHSCL